MNKFVVYVFTLCCVFYGRDFFGQNAVSNSGSSFVSSGDIFGTRVFIENKGQFQNPKKRSERVLFVYDHGTEKIYFTEAGLIYEFKEAVSKNEERGRKEKNEEEENSVIKKHFVRMDWIGANKNVRCEAFDKQNHYFTFGGPEHNSWGYKKIIFRNVYNGVDIEYQIPEEKESGVKYNVILHPGADPASFRAHYSGCRAKPILPGDGNVVVETDYDDIVEHAPRSFKSNGEPIPSAFVLNAGTIGFKLQNENLINEKITIDPWVNAVTTFSGNNMAYDVDYDFAGNLFIYGGINPLRVAKYNGAGVLQWTFGGILTNPTWSATPYNNIGNFAVVKPNGKCHIGQGWNNSGTKIIRLDQNGNYDNLISGQSGHTFEEAWDLGYNCSNQQLYVFGGTTSGTVSVSLINQVTGSISPVGFFNPPNSACDLACHAFDNTGDVFIVYAGQFPLLNKIARVNAALTTSVWLAPTSFFDLNEAANKVAYVGLPYKQSNGYNCLAANSNYLFFYNGTNLGVYNKTTGARTASLAVPNSTVMRQGGIAVDECNNLYLGSDNTLLCYNYNGVGFSTLTPVPLGVITSSADVYDIKYNDLSKTLFVSGRGFAGTYSAVNSLTCANLGVCACNVTPTISVSSNSISCASLGSATISAAGLVGITGYSWIPVVQNGSVAVGIYPGTHTVLISNQGCNNTLSTTVTFTSPVAYSGTVANTAALSCNGVNNGTASILISGGTGNTNYLWTSGINTQTIPIAAGLAAGNYTINISDALTNCSTSRTFTVTQPTSLTLNVGASSSTACAGKSITLSGTTSGGVGGYTYTWTAGPQTATYSASQATGGTYVYTLSSRDANLCPITKTISVGFVNNPVINLSSTTICPTYFGTLTVNGANSYTWSPGAVNGNSYTASPPATSIYSVVGSALSCTSIATASIVVKPVPTLSFTTYSITCASLGIATVYPAGGIGPFNYTWLPTAQTNSVASSLPPGTYTLYTFDGGTGCTSTATTVFNSLIPLSGNLLNSPSVTCNGAFTGSATVTNLAGGSPSQNYLWSNGISTHTSQLVNTISAGNWSVTVTDALTGCIIYSVFTVTQPPALTLNIASNTPTQCATYNIALTSTASGGTPGYNFSWAGGPTQSSHTVSETFGGNYIYTLNAQDSYSCSVTNTISVSFVNNPVLISTPVHICPLAVGIVTVSGATTYTWFNNTTGNMFADSPTVSTGYSVVGSALGCTSSINAWIILKTPPTPVFGYNGPVCEGRPLLLSVSNASLYSWDGPNGFSSIVKNPTINLTTLAEAGLYNVTVTAINGCTGTTSGNVIVKPLPTLTITPSTSSICLNTNSVALLANGTATLFNWSPNTGLSGTTGSTVSAFPQTTKAYTVVGSLNSCTAASGVTVAVVPPPPLFFSLTSGSFCAQAFNGSANSVTLTPGGALSYTLNTPQHVQTQNPNGPLMPINMLPPYQPTGHTTATLLGTNGVCTVAKTVTFIIIPNPSITVSSPTPFICAGESFTYTNSGATSYVWNANTPGLNTYTGSLVVANPTVTSVFSVYGSSLGCQSTTQSNTLTVYPLPQLKIVPDSQSVCIGRQVAVSVSGASTYVWTGPGFLAGGQQVSIGSQQSPGVAVYTVVGKSVNNCTAVTNATVVTLELPVPKIEIFPSQKICLNAPFELSGSGGKYYDRTLPNNYKYSIPSVSLVANNLDYSGIYYLKVTSVNGCTAAANTTVDIKPLPIANLSGPKQGCAPSCQIFGIETNSSVTSRWYLNDSKSALGVNGGGSGTMFKVCFTDVGENRLRTKLLDSITGCSSEIVFFVTTYEKPEADFTWLPEHPVEALDEVVFMSNEGNDPDNNPIRKWNWFFVNNELQSQNQNTSYRFTESGNYPVALVVKNKWGCLDTIVKMVVVEPDFHVYVPNVFTPNGDGINDIFLPITSGIKKYNLTIFNRWGQEVFQSFDAAKGWDGEYHGEIATPDSYVYRLSVSSLSGVEKKIEGKVLLIR